jgi:hypothetical protein
MFRLVRSFCQNLFVLLETFEGIRRLFLLLYGVSARSCSILLETFEGIRMPPTLYMRGSKSLPLHSCSRTGSLRQICHHRRRIPWSLLEEG